MARSLKSIELLRREAAPLNTDGITDEEQKGIMGDCLCTERSPRCVLLPKLKETNNGLIVLGSDLRLRHKESQQWNKEQGTVYALCSFTDDNLGYPGLCIHNQPRSLIKFS